MAVCRSRSPSPQRSDAPGEPHERPTPAASPTAKRRRTFTVDTPPSAGRAQQRFDEDFLNMSDTTPDFDAIAAATLARNEAIGEIYCPAALSGEPSDAPPPPELLAANFHPALPSDPTTLREAVDRARSALVQAEAAYADGLPEANFAGHLASCLQLTDRMSLPVENNRLVSAVARMCVQAVADGRGPRHCPQLLDLIVESLPPATAAMLRATRVVQPLKS